MIDDMFNPHIIPKLMHEAPLTTRYWEAHDDEAKYDLNGGHERYSKTSITYNTNLHGYRSPDFNMDRTGKFTIVVVGCSNTKGVGLPLEETYGELFGKSVERIVGKEVVVFNLGHGGASNEKIAIRSLRAAEHLRPDFFVTQWSYANRLLAVRGDGELLDWWSLTEDEMQDPDKHHLKIKYIRDIQTDWNDMQRYLNIARTTGMILNKKLPGFIQHMMFRYTETSPMDRFFDPRYTISEFIPNDKILARDHSHRGWTTHKIVAEKLTERFQTWWDTKNTA